MGEGKISEENQMLLAVYTKIGRSRWRVIKV